MNLSTWKPWHLRWTPEHIRRFWDWYAQHTSLRDEYFSKSVGHSMLDEVRRHIQISGLVVDLGAGPGFVTGHLLAAGLQTLAIDSSKASIEALGQRFGGHPQFRGAQVSEGRLPLEDATADVVLLVETIEHVEATDALALLRDVHRVLRPNGHVVMTTPNGENLTQNEVMCPDCGCVFHRMQHLRSFSSRELAAMAEQANFRTLTSRATYFSPLRGLHRRLEWVRRGIERRGNPHLLYIGRRRGSPLGPEPSGRQATSRVQPT